MKNYQCLFPSLVAFLFKNQTILKVGIIDAIVQDKSVCFVEEEGLENDMVAIRVVTALLDIFNEMGKLRPAGWLINDCMESIRKSMQLSISDFSERLWLPFIDLIKNSRKKVEEGSYVVRQICQTPIGSIIFLEETESKKEVIVRYTALASSLKSGDCIIKESKKALKKIS